MVEVRGSAAVPMPAAELFAFVSDVTNNPTWQRGMVSCAWTTPPPLAVGSRYEQLATFLGREIRSTFEVAELARGRRVRIVTVESTIPLDVTREVEPVTGGSRVTATIRGGPTGPAALLDPLTRRLVERSVRADYRRLESLLGGSVAD